ncbi:protein CASPARIANRIP INTEGRITY FACTOR 1-like [Populus alba x Populus x berolinensis]|nr:protein CASPARIANRIP INTEGRITY FACTOR 1-like [Populus alba x Populus x berolinensis]
MGLMLLKKISLLFLLISASFLSTSIAGRLSKSVNKLAEEVEVSAATYEETSSKPSHNNEATTIHERLLRANTKDYGNYNPAPALVRPPFKLIPN